MELDAALLMVPLVGFLPADDERVRGTLAAIEQELLVDGYVQQYTQTPENTADGCRPVRARSWPARLLAGRR
jgi:GH15 family glucan-1,4-alpha-glucosidase